MTWDALSIKYAVSRHNEFYVRKPGHVSGLTSSMDALYGMIKTNRNRTVIWTAEYNKKANISVRFINTRHA